MQIMKNKNKKLRKIVVDDIEYQWLMSYGWLDIWRDKEKIVSLNPQMPTVSSRHVAEYIRTANGTSEGQKKLHPCSFEAKIARYREVISEIEPKDDISDTDIFAIKYIEKECMGMLAYASRKIKIGGIDKHVAGLEEKIGILEDVVGECFRFLLNGGHSKT